MLERKCICDIPDEFLFTPLATIKELSLAVKLGHLTTKQQQSLGIFNHLIIYLFYIYLTLSIYLNGNLTIRRRYDFIKQ
jgi:hypothetical protein